MIAKEEVMKTKVVTISSLEWKFTFGKYKGSSIQYVIDENPSYIIWVRDNIEWLELDISIVDRAFELLSYDVGSKRESNPYYYNYYDEEPF